MYCIIFLSRKFVSPCHCPLPVCLPPLSPPFSSGGSCLFKGIWIGHLYFSAFEFSVLSRCVHFFIMVFICMFVDLQDFSGCNTWYFVGGDGDGGSGCVCMLFLFFEIESCAAQASLKWTM